jgi:hypothetical protein
MNKKQIDDAIAGHAGAASALATERETLEQLGDAYDGPRGRLMRALLPFVWSDGAFYGRPQRPFRPKGLIIWGAPRGATVYAWIGCTVEGVVAYAGIPAKWFASGESYEQIRQKLEAGIEVPDWMTWDTVPPGIDVRIEVRDAADSARMLGPADGIELLQWGEALAFGGRESSNG